jgi:hypothetical protein
MLGLNENRKFALIDGDRDALASRGVLVVHSLTPAGLQPAPGTREVRSPPTPTP